MTKEMKQSNIKINRGETTRYKSGRHTESTCKEGEIEIKQETRTKKDKIVSSDI
jgi:hypothetical protein